MKITKNNQFGRSLLSNCCSDAKIFLSDVYKKGTQAKKYQADGQQCGRSMVEMLGVLAIIGVLSIGAIAGYSKAMEKYKLNKTIEEINTIVQNFRTLCSGRRDICSTTIGTNDPDQAAILKKLAIIPDYLWDNNSRGGLTNRFGGESKAGFVVHGNDANIHVVYSNIPYNICIGLVTADWDNILDMDLYEGGIFTHPDFGGTDQFPISLERAHNACKKNITQEIYFLFK